MNVRKMFGAFFTLCGMMLCFIGALGTDLDDPSISLFSGGAWIVSVVVLILGLILLYGKTSPQGEAPPPEEKPKSPPTDAEIWDDSHNNGY